MLSNDSDWLLDTIKEEILELIESGEVDADDVTEEKVSELTASIIEELGMDIYHEVMSNEDGLRRWHETKAEFEQGINNRWGKPLELLERFIIWSNETGQSINEEHRFEAAQDQDFVFDALVRLHARATQVAMEIHYLLTAGFADGAFARWRSLYELSIIT